MDRKIALVFPGQGSQKVGMGNNFYKTIEYENLFQTLQQVNKTDIKKLCSEGPEVYLNETKNCQPAIVIISLIIYEIIKKIISPEKIMGFAGLSLGEYSALCASGALTTQSTLFLITMRAEFMQDACNKNEGSMAIIFNIDDMEVSKICNKFSNVNVANVNCPGQIVISGSKESVEKVCSKIKQDYHNKTKILDNVSGAFHSSLMKYASLKLEPIIEDTKVYSANNFYSTMIDKKVSNPREIKTLLKKQIEETTYFQKTIENMITDGINCFIEIGYGKTLSGMITKIVKNMNAKNIEIYNFETLEEINNFNF